MARYENAKNATPNWPHADQNGVPVSRDNTDGGYWDNNNNNDNNEWSWSPGVDSLSRLKSMEANKGFSSSGGSTFDTHGGSTIGTHGESTIANQKEYPEWHAPEAGLEAVNVGAPPVSQAKQVSCFSSFWSSLFKLASRPPRFEISLVTMIADVDGTRYI